jgi:Pro-kumamolisin, activation domain/Bacterial Ig-like domain (group 3)
MRAIAGFAVKLSVKKCLGAATAASKVALKNRLYIGVGFALLGFTANAGAQAAPGVRPRITAPLDETIRTKLSGNTHPLARAEYDRGTVADSQPLRRMLLSLKRSTEQEAALKALLDQQQSQSSQNYHRWLTPQEFGRQFGPADSDIETVSGWLQAQGFQIARVSAGKTVIEFSGTAGQVRGAFQTEIHKYVVNGQERFANASDPQIPTALAPVVAGTVSLHNFPKKPQSHIAGVFTRSKISGTVRPLTAAKQLAKGKAPGGDFTFSSPQCPLNNTCFALGPSDFGTIYNVLPVWSAGITGGGQTIAIVGDSEICTATSPDFGKLFTGPLGNTVICNSDDVANFRSLFNLPANSPNVIVDGPDPGFNADEIEGALDVEWAGAIAHNATIDFVIAEDTETSAGVDLAAEYAVDNNLAPVLSESFGQCEEFLGTGNQFYSNLWEQAAAQGITVIVASGDSGSAGCDFPGPFAAQLGVAVNGIASTPFNVAAGGTDFDITAANYASTYWNDANGNAPGTQASAKSYIPETSWNDSCAQNFTGSLAACDFPTLIGLNVVGGGGGESSCSNSIGPCGGGYPKPVWQSGPYVTGMASTDGVRDLPDVSFFAADGLISGSFYVVCEQDLDLSATPCSLSSPSNFTTFIGVGGTSSAAPAFAGVMALVNQQASTLHGSNNAIPTRQGNANYTLYALANAQKKANLNCDSTMGPASGCTFYDVTHGNNSVPCYSRGTNCAATTPNPYGVLEPSDSAGNLMGTIAFNSSSGYDLATGLGTINVANLVKNWATVAGTFTPTKTTLSMCAPPTPCTPTSSITITQGQGIGIAAIVAPIPPASGTPTGDISLIATTAQGAIASFTLSGGSVSAQLGDFPGGTYTVIAHYAGDGTFGASDSAPISLTVSPLAQPVNLSAPVLNFVNGTIAQNGGMIDFGDAVYLRSDVSGPTGVAKATGTIAFKDTTTTGTTTLGTVALNSEAYAELQMGANVAGIPSSVAPLAIGSHTIMATYSGDASYKPGSSFPVTINVAAAPTTTTVTVGASDGSAGNCAGRTIIQYDSNITVSPNTCLVLNAIVDTQSPSNPSGGSFGSSSTGSELVGTLTFFSNGTQIGIPVMVNAGNVTADANGFVAAQALTTLAPTTPGTLSLTAMFTPTSANYLASALSSAASVKVLNNEGFTLTPIGTGYCSGTGAQTCMFVDVAGQTATSPVTVTSIGLSGTVTLTCSVKPRNPADLDVPVCSFTQNGTVNPIVNLTGNGSSGQRMLTITTTARSVSTRPAIHPQGSDWLMGGAMFSLVAYAFLLLNIRTRKLRPAATFALVLVIVAGAAIGCGGGNPSSTSSFGSGTGGSGSGASGNGGSGGGGTGGGGTGGGGATSNPGTTADIYRVSVTATPSAGTAIQTQFLVFVQ